MYSESVYNLLSVSVCVVFYQEENLSGWSIRRNADGQEVADYPLGQNVVLKPGAKLKVCGYRRTGQFFLRGLSHLCQKRF